MKQIIHTAVLLAFLSSSFLGYAQNEDQHPIFDYNEANLSSTAYIPDYESKPEKLKISGTVYEADGVTPADGVIVYFDQADETGKILRPNKDRDDEIYHRAWVKTDANGNYTLYTFVPGPAEKELNPRDRGLKHIHPVIVESDDFAYDYDSFLFEGDPNMTKRCKKRLMKKNYNSILKPELKGDVLEAQQNIILPSARQ
ncbi:hypothetical protein Q2T40_10610 [Winogradskyella maritima]|uniref:Protocatechuate 3,4-dioxygenase beta subunit n=1 Tax=Winogradskyella maritima TaxID=1517766 RepID=A0ABV8AIZ8_9FLAO|nr:hypothetical protein [Winogradskyella maritima]